MFTGIVEATGSIQAMRRVEAGASMTVSARGFAGALKLGESIAVNGVCLTAVGCIGDSFTFDLSTETLARSSFGRLREGTRVNLERALLVGSRMGGHFVQGHVDGVGVLVTSIPSGSGATLTFEFPRDLERYLVGKGSIALDGISLTIASIEGNSFSIAVIPHTLEQTNLGELRIGDAVNLEVDILAKYLERFSQLGIGQERPPRLSLEYLKEQGF